MKYLILFSLVTAIQALKINYVMAPVEIKKSPTDETKLLAIVPEKSARVVLVFDKSIEAQVEETEQFKKTFKPIKSKSSHILKLRTTKGTVETPTIVNIEDKKSGEKIAVMIMSEKVAAP